MKLSRDRAGDVFLLELVEGGAARGRYSMIGLDPDVIFRVENGRAEINRKARHDRNAFVALSTKSRSTPCATCSTNWPFPPSPACPPTPCPRWRRAFSAISAMTWCARWSGWRRQSPIRSARPDSLLVRPTLMAVFDSVRDEISLVTPVRPQAGVAAKAAYESALDRLEAAVAVLEGPLRHEGQAQDALLLQTHAPVSNTTEAQYLAMVEQAKSYIRAGDIFQVVLSQRFTSPFQLPAFSLYRALRRVNPAPFLCYLDFGGFQIVCSSPEILVRAREGKVTIRPIAGTRWRGETKAQDDALAAELLADEKERAEHLMLLDLGRNDVGRVAEIGTVEVTEKFVIERYSHVMHIVSNVEGKLDSALRRDRRAGGGFPAGTVSGAPKVRAMEIIDELEIDKRGIYAGCIGYFGASGEMDTCIVLRTSVVKDGFMHVQAGAGIVYDSDPASEQRECANKARALFRAAEEALRFASTVKRGQ